MHQKNVDWSKLAEYEMTDMTVGSQELACTAGVCEVVDLVPPTTATSEAVVSAP